MGKASRRKKNRVKSRPKSPLGLELKMVSSPFANFPQDELTKVIAGFGKEQVGRFASTTAAIRDLIARVEPRGPLSCLAAYGITGSMDADGLISQSTGTRLFPPHIELAQMVALSIAPNPAAEIALSKDVGSMFELLPQWADQFHWKRLTQVEQADSDQAKDRILAQEQMRTTTQMVRNWGFYDQVKRIGAELLTPLDARFETEHGFRLTDLILIFDHMFAECQRCLNDHFDRLRPMIGAKTFREAAHAYFTAIPGLKGSPESFERLLRERRASVRAGKIMMLSHADLRLPDCYTFTADEVGTAIGRPSAVVDAALRAVSHEFGDLQGANVEHGFMNNPVWTKPAVKVGEGSYFCPIPQTFFAFLFETALSLLTNDASLREAYDKRRSDFLEAETTELFRNAFSDAKLTPNFKWKSPDGSQEFESDLVVDMDSVLILVEAKSGRVSAPTRRGAPDSLGEDIDSLLIEPSRQSQRLEEAIEAARTGAPEMESFRQVFPGDLKRVNRISRLSVTLEDIGFMHTNVNALKDAGYVPKELAIAPAATLADLEVVFDILRSPLERIHYLVQRGLWEGGADYIADEIDLLAVYLNTGLTVGDIHKNTRLILVGASKPIDEYYEALRYGIAKQKPTYQATQWWKDLLAKIETKKPENWIEVGIVLLSAGYVQQVEIERRMKGLVAKVEKQRERAASENGLIFVASSNAEQGIIVLGLMDTQIPDRFRLMGNMASHAFAEHTSVARCVAIMINVDAPMYPYNTLATFTKTLDP